MLELLIPESFVDSSNCFASYREKSCWNKLGMYGRVYWDWIRNLSSYLGSSKVLEVMAGAGWLSAGLKSLGIDIIATDDYSWYTRFIIFDEGLVEKIDAVSAVKKYGSQVDYIIMSWPYMDNFAYEVLMASRQFDVKIIYIGEWTCGCTANDNFFENLTLIDDEAFKVVSDSYCGWESVTDEVILVR